MPMNEYVYVFVPNRWGWQEVYAMKYLFNEHYKKGIIIDNRGSGFELDQIKGWMYFNEMTPPDTDTGLLDKMMALSL